MSLEERPKLMGSSLTVDPIWEQKYRQGYATRYPWNFVVTFLFTHCPLDKECREIKVLEVGSGSGSNLWCAAREGFAVAGVDASPSAVQYARDRFERDGLVADLQVGDFTELTFSDAYFDLAIDRAAITCVGFADAQRAVGEVWRVLAPEGKFLFNVYSDRHSSCATGEAGPGGVTLNISGGTLTNEGQIRFYNRRDIDVLFETGWRLLAVEHLELSDRLSSSDTAHAEWRVIAQKA